MISPAAAFIARRANCSGANEFVPLKNALVARIDEVVKNLSLGTPCDANELGSLLVFESGVAFGDVARRRSSGVVQLIAEFESAREFRSRQKLIREELQFICELPSCNLSKIPPPGHAVGRCKCVDE
jgi:hypothetical protein